MRNDCQKRSVRGCLVMAESDQAKRTVSMKNQKCVETAAGAAGYQGKSVGHLSCTTDM
jgi:hypothetical protein